MADDDDQGLETSMQIRMSWRLRERITKAARRRGLSDSAWIRMVLHDRLAADEQTDDDA